MVSGALSRQIKSLARGSLEGEKLVLEMRCYHCADCWAGFSLNILMVVQYSQAGSLIERMPGLGWHRPPFVSAHGPLRPRTGGPHVSPSGQESLIRIGIVKKLAGFLCRLLPLIVPLAS